MRNDADLTPMNPADILRMTPERALNIAMANVRNPNSLGDIIAAATRRVVELNNEIERLEALWCVYDLEPKKVKISKRVAKVPKYARSVTKGRAMSTVGDSYMKGGVKSRGQDFADKAAV